MAAGQGGHLTVDLEQQGALHHLGGDEPHHFGSSCHGSRSGSGLTALLGKDARRVFPLRFESEVELVGGPVKSSVPGFLVLEDFQTRKTRTVV